jgi:hypothetical protein
MTALLTAVATATAAVPRLYAMNSVPASPSYPYGSYSATFGRGDAYTLDVSHGLRWGRVTVQTFGRTADSALSRMDEVVAALLDQRLTITGYSGGPLVLELDPAVTRDPDDNGVVGVTATFTFTATKES